MFPLIALFLQAAATPAPAPAPWAVTVRPKTDPAITSTLTAVTSDDVNARLVVRCDAGPEKVVSVQLFTRTVLGGPPDRPVTLTIDGGTPLGANWEFRDKAALMREDVAVTTLTTAIAGGKLIKLATTTATGDAVNASFAGPPSADPVKAVLAACDYTLGTPPVRAPKPAPAKKK